jgi:hypothetical protein
MADNPRPVDNDSLRAWVFRLCEAIDVNGPCERWGLMRGKS